jgi:mRNA deadenylase 3'-5' endonuclease subunit Ccr4
MSSSDFVKNKCIYSLAVFFFLLILPESVKSQQQTATKNQYPKPTAVNEDFNTTSRLLQRADEIRRSEPQKFQEIINKLARENRFTVEQRHLYNFLVGYGPTFHGEFNKAE